MMNDYLASLTVEQLQARIDAAVAEQQQQLIPLLNGLQFNSQYSIPQGERKNGIR